MLEGPNIILRLFTEDDLDECLALDSKYSERGDWPDARFRPGPPTRKKFQETGWWEDDQGRMLITNKKGRKLGVIVFFKPADVWHAGYEIGYGVFRRVDRGHGYVSEALRIFSAYLFDLKPIPRLQIRTAKGNIASRRVAEKCGYQYEGIMRKCGFLMGEYHDAELFSLLREECPSLSDVLRASASKTKKRAPATRRRRPSGSRKDSK